MLLRNVGLTMSSTERRNPNALKVLQQQAEELARRHIEVGWSVNMGAPGEAVTIAAYNTLGTETIPARDALTPAVTGKLDAINEHNVRAVQAMNTGKSPDGELTLLALELQDALQQSVEDFSVPPNAPSTIAQKGGLDDPLIGLGADGGRILANARARVVTGSQSSDS